MLDVQQDFRLAFGAAALRRVWTLAALTLVLAVMVRSAIQWLGSSRDPWLLVLAMPQYAAAMLPAALLPAAAAFRSARTSRRAIVTSAVLVVALTAAAWTTAVPAAQSASSAYALSGAPGSQLTPLAELSPELRVNASRSAPAEPLPPKHRLRRLHRHAACGGRATPPPCASAFQKTCRWRELM